MEVLHSLAPVLLDSSSDPPPELLSSWTDTPAVLLKDPDSPVELLRSATDSGGPSSELLLGSETKSSDELPTSLPQDSAAELLSSLNAPPTELLDVSDSPVELLMSVTGSPGELLGPSS